MIQGEQNLGLGRAGAAKIQIVGDHLEELLGGDARVEDEGELDELSLQKVAQALEHGGLAGAHLAGQDDESLAALDAVDQVRQRLFVLRAAIEETQDPGSG